METRNLALKVVQNHDTELYLRSFLLGSCFLTITGHQMRNDSMFEYKSNKHSNPSYQVNSDHYGGSKSH